MITLRKPQQGSTYSLDTNVIYRDTAGGQLHAVRPSSWSSFERFKWIFQALSIVEKDALVAFICTNAARTVTINDENANAWTGIIVSEEITIEQTHRSVRYDDCDNAALFSISFEFEGSQS